MKIGMSEISAPPGTEAQMPETNDGRKARQYKGAISSVLDELIETMEDARKDGFIVEFSVGMQPEPDQRYVLTNLSLVKRW